MKLRGLDFETECFSEGNQAPQPVCLAVCSAASGALLHPTSEVQAAFFEALNSGDMLVGVNLAYDMCVGAKWLGAAKEVRRAYAEGRVLSLEWLDVCAQIEARTQIKKPSMKALCDWYKVDHADKEDDSIRLTYGQYLGAPLSAYSAGHIEYAYGDGISSFELGLRLTEKYPRLIEAGTILSRKYYWLQRMRNRGLATDPVAVAALEVTAAEEFGRLKELAGMTLPLPAHRELVRGQWVAMPAEPTNGGRPVLRANGTRDMARLRAWVSVAYDGNPPLTKPAKGRKSTKPFVPQISTSKVTISESGDPYLELLEEFGEWGAVINKDLKYLRRPVIHTRWGCAATTRVTSSNPNVQNPRRRAGIRECIVPRPGYCFLAADHIGVELVTAAEGAVSLLNRWDMADKLNAEIDLHCAVGSDLAECSYEVQLAGYRADASCPLGTPYKEYRQLGKVPNFGCLGGLTNPVTLSIYARGAMGIQITPERAERVLEAWRRKNPDGQALLDYVKWRLPKWGHGFEVQIPGMPLVRRGAPFCATANTLFQGRAAVLEAAVGWEIDSACESGGGWLEYCEPVHFVHDEFILECPIGLQTECGLELKALMISAAQPYVPHVRIDAEVTAMDRWSKKAKSLWRNDELQIWSPLAAA